MAKQLLLIVIITSLTCLLKTEGNDGDQCASNPCRYGGKCKDGIASYTCSCLDDYHGLNCEYIKLKYCKMNNGDCQHFCKTVESNVICSCANGYSLAEDGKSCVPTVNFPCGQIQIKKAKREARSLGSQDVIDNSTNYDDDALYEDVYFGGFGNSTIPPSLPDETSFGGRKDSSIVDGGSEEGRIVNGSACLLGQCPWQALLVNEEGEGFCGGTILNRRFVLTAAHCMNQGKTMKVLVGAVDLRSEEGRGMLHTVDKIIAHPRFVLQTYDFDIALLRLREPIQFSASVISACLPTPDFANDILMTQSRGTISGFGRTQNRGQISSTLQVINLPYVDRNTCKKSTNFVITENMFCAGHESSFQDACQGDSGGPHVTEYKGTYFVTGIVSWGEGCAKEGKYGVYTKVSKFIGWLKSSMARKPQRIGT
ncbi:coagulation factor X isoform X2 [Hemicordylus capensis]|uniref:coagulation factor X isoform X2 n=1 Tax=Hemicordylus capensis TaxID=884348 RepID=UPI002303CD98|nr:coagulation factor X isoform X2 [Hemicordylus capensis]